MDCIKTGQLIAAARREKGLTQRQLASALHVSDKAVSNWERGFRFPDVSLLEGLSAQLGLSVLEIIKGESVSGEPLSRAVADGIMCDMVGVQKSELRRANRKRNRIAAAVCALLLLAAAWAVLYFVPFTHSVSNHLDGVLYRSDAETVIPCTVTVEGTCFDYLFRTDRFDGSVRINGAPLGGGFARYTFGTNAALTSYRSSDERPDGTVTLYSGDVLINRTCDAVVISACFDARLGRETADEAMRCLAVAPAGDAASAESTLLSFLPGGLLPHFDTWNFEILSWH